MVSGGIFPSEDVVEEMWWRMMCGRMIPMHAFVELFSEFVFPSCGDSVEKNLYLKSTQITYEYANQTH